MTHEHRVYRPTDGHAPTDMALLARPLDFILQDHYREREICGLLDKLALHGGCSGAELVNALGFLTRELPLHLEDEERDLFPLLRDRCPPEDEIGKVIDRLCRDHGHAGDDTPIIIALLSELNAEGREATHPEAASTARYAQHSRRHLVLENAVILPLARARLSLADLRGLGRSMARRRGEPPPKKARS